MQNLNKMITTVVIATLGLQVLSLPRFIDHNDFSGLPSPTPLQVYNTYLAQDGNVVYALVRQDGEDKILKYDSSSEIPVYVGEYYDVNSMTFYQNLLLFAEYVIGYESGNPSLTIFGKDNFTFVGQHSYTIGFDQLFFDQSSQRVFFTMNDGTAGYIDGSNFPFGGVSDVYFLPNVFSQSCEGKLSYDGQYLALISEMEGDVFIIDHSFDTIVYSFYIPEFSVELDWHPTTHRLCVVAQFSNTIYIADLDNQTGLWSVSFNAQVINYTSVEIVMASFHPTRNTIIGAYRNFTDVKTYAYEYTVTDTFAEVGEILLENVYVDNTQILKTSEKIFIGVAAQTQIYTIYFSDCDVGYYLSSSDNVCILCTACCTECSEIGCGGCNNNTNSGAIEGPIYTEQFEEKLDSLNVLMDSTLESQQISTSNTVPGVRKLIKPLFAYFANYDELWLYTYHSRTYGSVITSLFQSIQQLQEAKWQLIPYVQLWALTNLDLSELESYFDYKLAFTTQKFATVEGGANGLFRNTFNFTLANLFFTVGLFTALNFVFSKSQQYAFSKILREFSVWPYLFVMLMDGNLQYFVYLCAFQIHNMFSFNFWHRVNSALVLVILFGLIWFCIFLYFYVKQNYKKERKYFFESVRPGMTGISFFLLNCSIRHLVFGIVHFSFQNMYLVRMWLLMGLQATFLLINCWFLLKNKKTSQKRRQKIFSMHLKYWLMGIISTLLRIVLIAQFIASYGTSNQGIYSQAFIEVELVVVFCLTYLHIISVFMFSFDILQSLFKMLRKKFSGNCFTEKEQLQEQNYESNPNTQIQNTTDFRRVVQFKNMPDNVVIFEAESEAEYDQQQPKSSETATVTVKQIQAEGGSSEPKQNTKTRKFKKIKSHANFKAIKLNTTSRQIGSSPKKEEEGCKVEASCECI